MGQRTRLLKQIYSYDNVTLNTCKASPKTRERDLHHSFFPYTSGKSKKIYPLPIFVGGCAKRGVRLPRLEPNQIIDLHRHTGGDGFVGCDAG